MTTARAQIKLAALADAEDEARDLVQSNQRRISELSHAIGLNPTGDKAANWEHELSRLRGKLSEYQARHQQRAALNAHVRQWLTRIAPTQVVEDAKLPKVKLKAGQTPSDAIAEVRGEISTLLSERLNVERAGLPVEEMKAQARKYVLERVIKGRPRIKADHDSFAVSFSNDTWAANREFQDILSWFDPDAMVQRLEEEIDAMPVAKLALTPAERAKRLATIKETLRELERVEEAHIEAAEKQDQYITRRPNASPEALLGIVLVKGKGSVAA